MSDLILMKFVVQANDITALASGGTKEQS